MAEIKRAHILVRKKVLNLGRLVINGDEIYELDECCLREKKRNQEKDRRRHTWEEQQRRKTDWCKESKP